MPEPTPTLPYHHYIPTPTPLVSVIATPVAPGESPASAGIVSLDAGGVWLAVVILAAVVVAYLISNKKGKRR